MTAKTAMSGSLWMVLIVKIQQVLGMRRIVEIYHGVFKIVHRLYLLYHLNQSQNNKIS